MNRPRPIIAEDPRSDSERAYSANLEQYLAGGGGEEALRNAYELGRSAIGGRVGVIDLAAMHHSALVGMLPRLGRAGLDRNHLERAGEFFSETLAPYEMAHRGYRDGISALRRLNETLEKEVQRMAHAVHDEAGQLLVAARLAIAAAARDLPASAAERLAEVGGILDHVDEQLRQISHELRPGMLDDLGLVAALEFLANGISKRSSLSVRVDSALSARCPPHVETAVYRIVQEALANATRHSGASSVIVRLWREANALCCTVRDDGAGFNVPAVVSRREQNGLGLLGIRERLNALGGTLEIRSQPDRGTELQMRIPLES